MNQADSNRKILSAVLTDRLLKRCPIWPDSPIERITRSQSLERVFHVTSAARAGGDYAIGVEARQVLGSKDQGIDDSVRARLVTILIEMRASGDECPTVTQELIIQATHASPMAVHKRADRLLTFIGRRCGTIDAVFSLARKDPEYEGRDGTLLPPNSVKFPNRYGALACTESSSANELEYIWEYIRDEMKWIKPANRATIDPSKSCIITPAGHARIAELSTRTDSAQAFVAMWFDDSMTDVYDDAIAPAIMAAGYDPFRVDREHFADPITDKIIAEIRRSRFLVSDFTHGDGGVRGSVYYEAGFAHGLNIPVIFAAKDGTKPHFDTSTYPHIFWKPDDLPSFKTALTNRILALKELGPGPRST